jgi:hypothetical protein
VFYIDAENFDCRLRVTRKFLLSKLLYMKYDVSVYKSTGEYVFLNADFNFTVTFFDLYVYIHA